MNKRIIAVLGVLIVVLSASLAGCGKKVTQEEKTTTDSGKIILDGTFDDIPEGSEIVIGNDGQSYLVDGEGNSVVYEAPSAYVIPNSPTPGITPPQAASSTTAAPTKKPPTTIRVIPSTTLSQKENVVNELSILRRSVNSDNSVRATLSNTNFATLLISAEKADDSGWRFEIHKGSYGSSTVGCEVAFYKNRRLDNFKCKAELYNGENKITSFDENCSKTGWKYSFVNSGISVTDPANLTMRVVVELETEQQMLVFTSVLEDNYGFVENSTGKEGNSPYRNKGNYSVNGPTEERDSYEVIFVW